MTNSNNESDKKGDFEVVYGTTCMTSSGRSVRDHHWCVWIYEAVVNNDSYGCYSKNWQIGVLIAIAYPFLLLPVR